MHKPNKISYKNLRLQAQMQKFESYVKHVRILGRRMIEDILCGFQGYEKDIIRKFNIQFAGKYKVSLQDDGRWKVSSLSKK